MSFKSFLNWIQNDGSDNKGSKQNESIDWTEKRRDNRLDLATDKPLRVHLMSEEAEGKLASTLVATVRNVSVRGCGLVFESAADCQRLKAKQVLLASLAVDDFPIPLQVEVVRLINDKEAAIRFRPPFPRELEKLEKFLEPRCLGRSLREIDPAKLQKDQQKGFRWFQGVNETHLFSWMSPETKQISQQQLVFLDHVVEWKEGDVVRSGMIRPDERRARGEVGWVKSDLLDFDAVADAAVVAQARTIVESCAIDGDIKNTFLKKIS